MAQAQLLRALSALPLLGAAAIAGISVGSLQPLAAQQPEELDLARVRARAASQAQEAEAFARAVARRGETLRAEAQTIAEAARETVRTSAASRSTAAGAVFDFDAMVRTSRTQAQPDEGARLIAFASVSMPADSLRQMIEDVGRAGGAIVFRGLPANSAASFTTALAKVLPQGEVQANVGIDPRLFRAFNVDAVPTYVVTATSVDLCDGLECRSTPPPHDQLRGNVSLRYALQTFADGRGPGAQAAMAFQHRLEAAR